MSYVITKRGIKYNDEYVVNAEMRSPKYVKYLPMTRTVLVSKIGVVYLLRDGVPIDIGRRGGIVRDVCELDDHRIAFVDENKREPVVQVYDFNTGSVRITDAGLPGASGSISHGLVAIRNTGVEVFSINDEGGLDPVSTYPARIRFEEPTDPKPWERGGSTESIDEIVKFFGTENRLLLDQHDGTLAVITLDNPIRGWRYVDLWASEPKKTIIVSQDESLIAACGHRRSEYWVRCYSPVGALLFHEVSEDPIDLIQFNGNELVVYIQSGKDRIMVTYNEDFTDASSELLDDDVIAIVPANEIVLM